MLLSLHVQNIAVIRDLTINFNSGLNVISGETGAGKSIVIDSLNFVLGERADRSLIRHGEKMAVVQASFYCASNVAALELLDEYGIEFDVGDGRIFIRRSMTQNGRSECKINGWAVTLGQLRRLVCLLIDVHSQHQTQSLMDEQTHISILDSYSKRIITVLEDYEKHFIEYKNLLKIMSEYPDESSLDREIDMLNYQITDIETARLECGEEELLIAERNRLQNNERLLESARTIVSLIDGGESMGIDTALSLILKQVSFMEKFDLSIHDSRDRFESVQIDINDLKYLFLEYLETNADGMERLTYVEQRIDTIRKIKRKYGNDITEILYKLEEYKKRLDFLSNAESSLFKIRDSIDKTSNILLKTAKNLNEERVKTGQLLSTEIKKQLVELGMKHAEFDVEVDFCGDVLNGLSYNGGDAVKFVISLNPGEPLKPLSKVASGGEMSRVMLAIKNITADLEDIETLIFDEIDTGISGNAAKTVAKKLYNIASTRQVIVVTHLAQIAAMADCNFLITKSTYESETVSEIHQLNSEETIYELMRILGSEAKSEVGYEHAKELKHNADLYKQI